MLRRLTAVGGRGSQLGLERGDGRARKIFVRQRRPVRVRRGRLGGGEARGERDVARSNSVRVDDAVEEVALLALARDNRTLRERRKARRKDRGLLLRLFRLSF